MILVIGDKSTISPGILKLAEVRFLEFDEVTSEVLAPFRGDLAAIIVFGNGEIENAIPVVEMIRENETPGAFAPRIVYVYEDEAEVLLSQKTLGDDFVSNGIINVFYRQKIMQLIEYRAAWLNQQKLLMDGAFFSERDELTGLANERRLIEYINLQVRDAFRNQSPISFIDIDIADALSSLSQLHEDNALSERDKFILRFTNKLKSAVFRPLDLIARVSDSRFIITLPKTSADNLGVIESRIKGLFESLPGVGDKVLMSQFVHELGVSGSREDVDLDQVIFNITMQLSS